MADIKSLNNQLQLVQQNGNHILAALNPVNSEKDLRMNVLHLFYDLIAELENEGPDFKQIQSKLGKCIFKKRKRSFKYHLIEHSLSNLFFSHF